MVCYCTGAPQAVPETFTRDTVTAHSKEHIHSWYTAGS
jgi:hypothetical protein